MDETFIRLTEVLENELPLLYREGKFGVAKERLLRMLEAANDREERAQVLDMLGDHFHFMEEAPAALEALRERATLLPKDARAWLGLAEHFHYHEPDLDKAAEYIEVALEKSIAQRQFVRQILGVRARIASERGSFEVVAESIDKLMNYEPPKNGLDVALEDDFVARIPQGRVDADVLNRYLEFVRINRRQT